MRTDVFDRDDACLKNGWFLAKFIKESECIVTLKHHSGERAVTKL